MASKSGISQYASPAVFVVTETAANTLTYEKLETGLSIYDHIGWVIQRAEMIPANGDYALFNTAGDGLVVSLLMSNALTAAQLLPENPALYMQWGLVRVDWGTAAAADIVETCYVKDYTGLEGGGMLVLPNPLYVGVYGVGLSGAATVTLKLWYKAIELSDQDYFNLVQSRQLLISS